MDMPTVAEHPSKEKLVDDLKMVVTDAEELLRATANQTGERVAAARAKAEESLRNAKVRLAEARASLVERTKVAAKATDEYVHENPWTAIGISAAVGIAIGTLISRR